jgi:hypothetical protein
MLESQNNDNIISNPERKKALTWKSMEQNFFQSDKIEKFKRQNPVVMLVESN